MSEFDMELFGLSSVDFSTTTAQMENTIIHSLLTEGLANYIDTNNTLINTASANESMRSYVSSLSISQQDGFSARWLSGKTLWDVHYSTHDNSWEKNKLVFSRYPSTEVTEYEDGETNSDSYSIDGNGMLIISKSYGDNSHIIVNVGPDCITMTRNGDTSKNAYFTFSEAKANELMASQ
jgi:hypothetical protein